MRVFTVNLSVKISISDNSTLLLFLLTSGDIYIEVWFCHA
jgi:hypothetical protein